LIHRKYSLANLNKDNNFVSSVYFVFLVLEFVLITFKSEHGIFQLFPICSPNGLSMLTQVILILMEYLMLS